MGVYCSLLVVLVFGFLTTTLALKCYLCGKYNDGVGSITPCLNHTHMTLQDCPPKDAYCIKYQSEGSLVRDCVAECTDRETWNARTYCCNNVDGCNSSTILNSGFIMILCATLFTLMH